MKRSGQFQSGQSGNKKGRPRGSKNRKKILESLLTERHRVIKDGKAAYLSTYHLITLTIRNLAMQGNLRAVMPFHDLLESADPQGVVEPRGVVVVPGGPPAFWAELCRQQQAWLQKYAERFEAGTADPEEKFKPNWELLEKCFVKS